MSRPSSKPRTGADGGVEALGEFSLQAELAGTHTRVHLATRPGAAVPAQRYAIKRLQPDLVTDPLFRALLLDSGRSVIGLRDPHLIQVLEVHERPEPFWVMEWVDAVQLSALFELAPSAELTRCVMPVLVDVLLGLARLNTRTGPAGEPTGLIHGAPCARHVLVGRDGVGRLIDFTHAIGPKLPWTVTHSARLTPTEMAPEQALAPAYVDARCDVFIVGTLLFRALTGRALFATEQPDRGMHALLRMAVDAPSAAGSVWGRGLDRVCLRALERARAGRFASAAEMAHTLRDEAQRAGAWAEPDEIRATLEVLLARGSGRFDALSRSAPPRQAESPTGPRPATGGERKDEVQTEPGGTVAAVRTAAAARAAPGMPLADGAHATLPAAAYQSAARQWFRSRAEPRASTLGPSESLPPAPDARRQRLRTLVPLALVSAAALAAVAFVEPGSEATHEPRAPSALPRAQAKVVATESEPKAAPFEPGRPLAAPPGRPAPRVEMRQPAPARPETARVPSARAQRRLARVLPPTQATPPAARAAASVQQDTTEQEARGVEARGSVREQNVETSELPLNPY